MDIKMGLDRHLCIGLVFLVSQTLSSWAQYVFPQNVHGQFVPSPVHAVPVESQHGPSLFTFLTPNVSFEANTFAETPELYLYSPHGAGFQSVPYAEVFPGVVPDPPEDFFHQGYVAGDHNLPDSRQNNNNAPAHASNTGRAKRLRRSLNPYTDLQAPQFFDYPKITYHTSTYAPCDGGFYVRCIAGKFRTIDGSCNNLLHPTWGKSNTCLPRLTAPAYADGYSSPRVSVTGSPLPSPRVVTTHLHPDVRSDNYYTGILMQWGQVVSHDITSTPNAESGSRKGYTCCPRPGHPECYPITIPADDYFYKYMNQTCMQFVRSKACDLCKTPHREHMNEVTAFLDGSLVYGSTQNVSLSLREFRGGRMLVSHSVYGAPMLPYSTSPFTDACSQPEKQLFCYRAGDNRANQNPSLVALHTILLRQHNRIAVALESLNPYWSDQRIYQEARRIVGAQIQAITYKEFLPLYIGQEYARYFSLELKSFGYTNYNDYLLPQIFNEFSGAAYRSGHTLVFSDIYEVFPQGDGRFIKLRDYYFYPFDFAEGQLDPILKGLLKSNCQSYDPFFTDDIKNHLVKKRGAPGGGDLPSINIQRGRDHGIPGYTTYLKLCFNKTIYSFEELDQFMPQEQRRQYQQIYRSVHDIDLFSAGVSERSLPGAVVGPTFACIIGLQFYHLKYGDRYYFEHGYQTGSFTEAQLQTLRDTTLSKLICANGDYVPYVQRNAFFPESLDNPLVRCSDIPDLDITLWKDNY